MADYPEPLDADRIRSSVSRGLRSRLNRVVVLAKTGSTNEELLDLPGHQLHGCVVLAELQTEGKGRRQRTWHAPRGNITMSLGWRLDGSFSAPGLLSLVAGVSVCRALARIGLRGHGVKWPNDILINGAKLAGILIESRHRSAVIDAVIGIGINLDLNRESAEVIDQPWTDLASQEGLASQGRNEIVALVLEELVAAIDRSAHELEAWLSEHWSEWDTLSGRQVRIERAGTLIQGRALGISNTGGLQIEVSDPFDGTIPKMPMTFHSGEVSVRHA